MPLDPKTMKNEGFKLLNPQYMGKLPLKNEGLGFRMVGLYAGHPLQVLAFETLLRSVSFLDSIWNGGSDLWGGGGPLERLGDLLFNMEIARYTSSKQGVCLCVGYVFVVFSEM